MIASLLGRDPILSVAFILAGLGARNHHMLLYDEKSTRVSLTSQPQLSEIIAFVIQILDKIFIEVVEFGRHGIRAVGRAQ